MSDSHATAEPGRPIRWAGGPFGEVHEELMGDAGRIDFRRFDPEAWPTHLIELARAVWADRVRTEFRSIQIMNRFLADVLEAGDPLDVYAGAVDFVADEVRHVALCARLVEAMGDRPSFPLELALERSAGLASAPAPARALNTAIGMLCINETISVAFISDLADRCTEPTVGAVLRATLADEAHHGEWGWTYAQKSLQRFDVPSRPGWRRLAADTLRPHQQKAEAILAALPPAKRHLAAWPDAENAALGLFCPERQALVFQRTLERDIQPRLRRLELA